MFPFEDENILKDKENKIKFDSQFEVNDNNNNTNSNKGIYPNNKFEQLDNIVNSNKYRDSGLKISNESYTLPYQKKEENVQWTPELLGEGFANTNIPSESSNTQQHNNMRTRKTEMVNIYHGGSTSERTDFNQPLNMRPETFEDNRVSTSRQLGSGDPLRNGANDTTPRNFNDNVTGQAIGRRGNQGADTGFQKETFNTNGRSGAPGGAGITGTGTGAIPELTTDNDHSVAGRFNMGGTQTGGNPSQQSELTDNTDNAIMGRFNSVQAPVERENRRDDDHKARATDRTKSIAQTIASLSKALDRGSYRTDTSLEKDPNREFYVPMTQPDKFTNKPSFRDESFKNGLLNSTDREHFNLINQAYSLVERENRRDSDHKARATSREHLKLLTIAKSFVDQIKPMENDTMLRDTLRENPHLVTVAQFLVEQFGPRMAVDDAKETNREHQQIVQHAKSLIEKLYYKNGDTAKYTNREKIKLLTIASSIIKRFGYSNKDQSILDTKRDNAFSNVTPIKAGFKGDDRNKLKQFIHHDKKEKGLDISKRKLYGGKDQVRAKSSELFSDKKVVVKNKRENHPHYKYFLDKSRNRQDIKLKNRIPNNPRQNTDDYVLESLKTNPYIQNPIHKSNKNNEDVMWPGETTLIMDGAHNTELWDSAFNQYTENTDKLQMSDNKFGLQGGLKAQTEGKINQKNFKLRYK